VHHQSGEFNLSVGLRGPWLSALQIVPFLLPIALLGIPSEVIFPLYAFHTVWKLFVHTRMVGKLGPLERVMATPSQHRVHHAINERYLDKNFGGLFSVWDRLFGTFQAEDEAPSFGPATPLRTLDPLANNLDPWRELRATARRIGWARALLSAPGQEIAPVEAGAPAPELPRERRVYVAAQLVGAAMVILGLVGFGDALPWPLRWGAGMWALATLVGLGGMLRGHGWARATLRARLAASGAP
jgi:hypothetical protein